jgi:hypothetical protein
METVKRLAAAAVMIRLPHVTRIGNKALLRRKLPHREKGKCDASNGKRRAETKKCVKVTATD